MSSKIKIDFHILPLPDPRILAIVDASIWKHLENKPAIIEITLPGETEPIVHFFEKGKVSIFNSINLLVNCGLPCGCDEEQYNNLPDGIYTITVKGSTNEKFTHTVKYLRTTEISLELDKMYLKESIKCGELSSNLRGKIEEIEFLLKAAQANTRLSQIQDAQELYLKAKSLMDKNCF
jgi:hypothetical protein